MTKNYGHKYFLKQRAKKSLLKKISFINVLLIILQIIFGSLFLIAPAANNEARANGGNMCSQNADTVLIMDRYIH